MSTMSKPAKVPSLGQEIAEAAVGLGLLVIYLTFFTVGSEVHADNFQDSRGIYNSIMFVLTYREINICLLAIVAACLGTWRRINQSNEGAVISINQPWFLAYTSACIGGLITTAVVVGLPNLLDQMSDLISIDREMKSSAGSRHYLSMAMLASAVAFFSGYDKTFLDRILGMINKKFGLIPAPSPESPRIAAGPRYRSKVPAQVGGFSRASKGSIARETRLEEPTQSQLRFRNLDRLQQAAGLVDGLVILVAGDAVVDDSSPSLDVGRLADQD